MIVNTCCKKNFIDNQVLFSSDAHIVSIVDKVLTISKYKRKSRIIINITEAKKNNKCVGFLMKNSKKPNTLAFELKP